MELTHIVLYVADIEASRTFYRDALGLTERVAKEKWVEFTCGELILSLHARRDGQDEASNTVHFVFAVEDIHAAHTRMLEQGVAFTVDPKWVCDHDTYAAWDAEFLDPDGHRLGIWAKMAL